MSEVRLIDANALKYKNLAEVNGRLTYVLTAEEIDNAPTVAYPFEKFRTMLCGTCQAYMRIEPDRPQGEWVKVKEEIMSVDTVAIYKCSKCERVIATLPSKLAEYYPFCHCGADMRKGGKAE